MATRIYCDNCGNTITDPNRYCFGPYRMVLTPAGQNMGAQQAGVNYVLPSINTPVKPQIPTEHIDLCDGCQSIWMDRVRKLTKESEPSA